MGEVSKNFTRINGETDEGYQIRLTLMKQDGIDIDWGEIAELVGDGRSSEAYRKDSYGIRRYNKYINSIKRESLDDSELEQLNEKILELKKEKIKVSDLKICLNKQARELARWEDLIDNFKQSIENDYGKQHIPLNVVEHIPTGRDSILMISDIHLGIEVNNNVNTYNPKIAKERLNKLIDETINRCKELTIDKLHVVILGDTISGLIHNTLRYESRLDISDQITEVSNVLVQCIEKLTQSEYIPFVTITSVNGNHDRIFANKDDNLPRDSFTKLVNRNIEKDLSYNDKVTYLHNTVNYDEIAVMTIKNKTFVAVHGDKVSKDKCKEQLENILSMDIDYILMGHWHEPNQKQINNTKVFINGSVVGTDSYASQKKLYTKPCQKLLFIDDYGIACYDIEL